MEILQNGFCMIPNVVLYDNELSDKQKLLYWVISSLCAEKWYCWASNKYLWELLWVKEWTISNSIKWLLEKWYIYSDINKSKGNERHISLTYCEKSQEGIVKNHKTYCGKSQEINIIDKDKINIINNNTEQSSENENNSSSIKTLALEEKEKNSAKKEKEIQELWKREKIDYLINQIKSICDGMNIAYDKTMDRQFAKHILTAKEYGEFCEKIKQDRITFALNVLIASIKINYWKWPLAWPKKIYQNYADLYNQAKSKMQKTITPTINVL